MMAVPLAGAPGTYSSSLEERPSRHVWTLQCCAGSLGAQARVHVAWPVSCWLRGRSAAGCCLHLQAPHTSTAGAAACWDSSGPRCPLPPSARLPASCPCGNNQRQQQHCTSSNPQQADATSATAAMLWCAVPVCCAFTQQMMHVGGRSTQGRAQRLCMRMPVLSFLLHAHTCG